MAQQSACKKLALECWWYIRTLFNCSAWWKYFEFMKNCFIPYLWNRNRESGIRIRKGKKESTIFDTIYQKHFLRHERKRLEKTRTTQEACTIIYSHIIKRLAISKSSFSIFVVVVASHLFSLKGKWISIYMHVVIVATADSILEKYRNVRMIRSAIVQKFWFHSNSTESAAIDWVHTFGQQEIMAARYSGWFRFAVAEHFQKVNAFRYLFMFSLRVFLTVQCYIEYTKTSIYPFHLFNQIWSFPLNATISSTLYQNHLCWICLNIADSAHPSCDISWMYELVCVSNVEALNLWIFVCVSFIVSPNKYMTGECWAFLEENGVLKWCSKSAS